MKFILVKKQIKICIYFKDIKIVCFLSIIMLITSDICNVSLHLIKNIMKYFTPFIAFLSYFLTLTTSAQVGINTTNPDPSAILDVSSEVGGFLAPRMTTLQREAIVNPAQGLLVYDTTEEAFLYYQDDWQTIGINNTRNNYKLVKDVTDLSDELAAGGGSTYVLNPNFLYEINGAIVLSAPINMNGAYIEGVDSSQDILVNGSGAALFQGSTGRIRNLTISGGGAPIFDITGTGSDLLLVNNTVFTGASTMGTLHSLGTAFFSVTQYVSNSDGFDLTDIGSFFMSNVFWTTSNTGAFATISGTFNNFQIVSGRIEADAGEIGVDVSANPIITNEASLNGLSFVGAGALVSGYTVGSYIDFSFTTDWNVNCSGIPTETDDQSTANFFSTSAITSGFAQNITNNTAVPIVGNGAFANTELFRFRSNAANNRLIYEGKKNRNFQVSASLSVRVASATNDFYSFIIAKNGVVVDDSDTLVLIESDNQIQSVSINTVVTLDSGDFVEIYAQRLTGTGTDQLVVFSENLTVR